MYADGPIDNSICRGNSVEWYLARLRQWSPIPCVCMLLLRMLDNLKQWRVQGMHFNLEALVIHKLSFTR